MKKKLFCFMLVFGIIASIVTLIQPSVFAASCGTNLSYSLRSDGTLTIRGTGTMSSFKDARNVPWFSDRNNIKKVVILDGVTSIGDLAFIYCTNITSITIPTSITSIGSDAFMNATSLTDIYITDLTAWCNINFENIYANPLSYADNLYINNVLTTNISIPANVTSIKAYTFYNYTTLESITIPDSITSIGVYAFYNCTNLKQLYWNAKCVSDFSSSNYVFGCAGNNNDGIDVFFGDNVEYIPSYLFYPYSSSSYSPNIKNITFGNNVTSIGEYSFGSCANLTSLVIPNSVITIGKSAFLECLSLESITLPFVGSSHTSSDCFGYVFAGDNSKIPPSLNTVTITNAEQIPAYAFSDCNNLKNISINKDVTNIGSSALSGCSSLETLSIPFIGSSQNANGTSDAVFGYLFGNSSFTDATCTTQYYSSSDSTTYYIPSSLKTVNITTAKNIPYGAFSGCAGIENISLNSDISTVSAKAFSGCNSLLKVDMLSKNAKFVKSNIFEDCDFVTLYGYSDSTAETYADTYGIDFVAYSSEDDNGDDSTGTDTDTDTDSNVTINASCYIDDNKIILSLCFDKFISNKEVICGFYDESGVLIDLHTVPVAISTNCVYVSIPDNSKITTVKTMIWDSLEEPNPASLVNPITVAR